ncbi:MAG: hypothetical protein ABMA64_43330, partial [Myxococcota bacterium]
MAGGELVVGGERGDGTRQRQTFDVDAFELGANRFQHLRFAELGVQRRFDALQVDARRAALGQIDLRVLRARREFMPEALREHRHQAFMLQRIGVVAPRAALLGHALRRVHGV